MSFDATRSRILVIFACSVLTLAPAVASAQSYESWTEWYEATGGDGPFPGGSGPISPPGSAPQGVTFYTDAATFDGDFPGLPIEDFEESPVPPATATGCEEPIDENSSDSCFSPGDILPNLAIRTVEGTRSGCPAECPMVVLGGGVLGNVDHVAGPNFFVDSMRVEAFEDVCAMGMFLYNSPSLESLDVTVTTVGQVIQTTADASPDGLFWGVETGTDPILQIDFASGSGGGELADEIRFGVDTCAPPVPTTGGYGAAALAALLLGAGPLALRRRQAIRG